jgi:hypothetical protein
VKGHEASVVATDGAVIDGPSPESKEHLGGFAVVDVPSHEEALKWAAKIAVACRCAQEVRELAGPDRLIERDLRARATFALGPRSDERQPDPSRRVCSLIGMIGRTHARTSASGRRTSALPGAAAAMPCAPARTGRRACARVHR